MANAYIAISAAGPNRDLTKDARAQAGWDEHAPFIDRLVAEGFVMMGGPLPDEGGALLIVMADDEQAVREILQNDPWYRLGILTLTGVKRWDIFIDRRS